MLNVKQCDARLCMIYAGSCGPPPRGRGKLNPSLNPLAVSPRRDPQKPASLCHSRGHRGFPCFDGVRSEGLPKSSTAATAKLPMLLLLPLLMMMLLLLMLLLLMLMMMMRAAGRSGLRELKLATRLGL